MRLAATAAFGALVGTGLAVFPDAARAASFECYNRPLSPAQVTICEDAQLSRTDEQVARRLATMLRRLSFGQYLGLRLWESTQVAERSQCGADRACLTAAYRAQSRFLDRLQQCLDAGAQRRVCLRSTLSGGGRETVRR